MSEFTYESPDSAAYLHTIRLHLESTGETELALLLQGATVHVSHDGQYSRIRWNGYATTVTFYVPGDRLARLADKEKKKVLLCAADDVMPKTAGLDVCEVVVSPILEAPPEGDGTALNQAHFLQEKTIEHDGLRFRSKTEIKIYDALKKRKILFFPLAAAVFGGQKSDYHREPDFVICSEGKWGILEVMGDWYHTSTTAVKDHERGRLFNDHRIHCIHFYDATRCYNKPDEVVDDFLKRLAHS
jgi:hypothetical protein